VPKIKSNSKVKVGYVDGFVLPVKKSKIKAYKKAARFAAKVWMEHGALSVKECQGDDLNIKFTLPFPKLVKPKKGETIFYSYIEYKSKAHRDEVNKKVMKEMEAYQKEHPDHMKNMPFDMKRFAYGGFKIIVDA